MITPDRYQEYDSFAAIYNKHWGDFAVNIIPTLEKFALNHLPEGARILDLCCGTGQLAKALTARGYRITGVDGSEEMLIFARQNAPECEFIAADARDFEVGGGFSAVFSTYDSLNHVMEIDELAEVFTRVKSSLAPEGIFVFDLNVEEGFKARWRGSFGIVEDDHAVIAASHYAEEERRGWVDFTFFFKSPEGDDWSRKDLTLIQRAHHVPDVIGALKSAGFTDVAPHTHLQGRVFFVAR